MSQFKIIFIHVFGFIIFLCISREAYDYFQFLCLLGMAVYSHSNKIIFKFVLSHTSLMKYFVTYLVYDAKFSRVVKDR